MSEPLTEEECAARRVHAERHDLPLDLRYLDTIDALRSERDEARKQVAERDAEIERLRVRLSDYDGEDE